jgi:putative hydrolase of the HAD superfamily
MALRLITVDLWNTLVGAAGNARRQAERVRRVRAFVLETLGLELSEAVILKALRETWDYYNRVWRGQQRTPTPEELTAFLFRLLDLPDNPQQVRRLAEELAYGVLEAPPPLLPHAREALQELAQRYRLGIISDTAFSPGRVLRELLRHYGIEELFAAWSFSDETGVAKPHPRAYKTVLEALHLSPEQALHVGDLEPTDIYGAKRLGMAAILFLGDPESEFPPPQKTRADAIARHWSEVPVLVEQLHTPRRGDATAGPSA